MKYTNRQIAIIFWLLAATMAAITNGYRASKLSIRLDEARRPKLTLDGWNCQDSQVVIHATSEWDVVVQQSKFLGGPPDLDAAMLDLHCKHAKVKYCHFGRPESPHTCMMIHTDNE